MVLAEWHPGEVIWAMFWFSVFYLRAQGVIEEAEFQAPKAKALA
jgi:hypothetical protein